MNFENWQYHEDKLPKDLAEKRKHLDQLFIQFKEEIENNEAATKWLAEYNYRDKDKFLEDYIRLKVKMVEYSSIYIDEAEQIPEFRFWKETEEAFNMLLIKKLFDLECKWRADTITLPGVRICLDFFYWQNNIRNCPFLEPVTSEELELLRRFVLTDDFWDGNWSAFSLCLGQKYETLTEQDEEGNYVAMPDWYEYYDLYMGTGHVLLLPDVRGPKEMAYLQASSLKEKMEKQANPPVEPTTPLPAPTPYIPHSNFFNRKEEYYQLASCFEDGYFKTLMKAAWEKDKEIKDIEEGDEDAEDYIVYMRDIADLPPVRAGLSWRKALRWVYQDYVSSRIHAGLPAVCEEYTMYRSMGFQAAEKDKTSGIFSNGIYDMIMGQILDGREFLGEPRDLDF